MYSDAGNRTPDFDLKPVLQELEDQGWCTKYYV
jgi:hypothetical protein